MHIRVVYSDNRFDYVTGAMLDISLSSGTVKQFYHYSESKWVTVGKDPTRGRSTDVYLGPERRNVEMLALSAPDDIIQKL